MGFLDKHPGWVRFAFGSIAAVLLSLAAGVIFLFGSSPTDENWFRDSPSRLYVTRPLASGSGGVSMEPGDLLMAVAGRKVVTLEQFRVVVAAKDSDQYIELALRRPATDGKPTVLVRPREIPEDLIREIGLSVEVIDVIEGGASDRAGMKRGDLILRINGQEFETALQADEILRSGTIGKTIEYEVLRENRILSLHVTLAAFGFPLANLTLTLCGLFYMGTGIFLGLHRPRFPAARLLGLFFLLFGFFMAIVLLQRGSPQAGFAVLRNAAMVLSLFYGVAAMLHANHHFPIARPDLLRRTWIRRIGYLLPVVFIPVVFLLEDRSFLICFGAMVLYAVVPQLVFRRQAPPDYRRLNTVIRWTGILVFALSLVFVTLISRLLGGNAPNVGYLGFILIAIPLSYLYTIGRYRLLDIDLRVRKNVQYSFVSLVLTLAGVFLLTWLLFTLPRLDLGLPNVRITGASIEVMDQPMTPGERLLAEKGVLMVLAVVATFLVWGAGRTGHQFLARYFHRQEYDYRRAATDLADVMATRLTMADLSRGVVERLTSLMRLKRAGVLFFRNRQECCCHEAEGFDGREWADFCVRNEKELIEAFGTFKREFRVEYLPPSARKAFQEHRLEIVVPVRSKDKLLGAILVGEKLSESPFNQEDLDFLSTAARQASVAIENAFLHEELTEQERLRHELAIARRIQLASLPQSTPSIPGLDIAGISLPAMEVGGDYFDYLNGDVRHFAVIVGDVSGKGTSAALYMSKIQGILRSLHGFGLSPRELFVRTNRLLCQDMEKNSFVTAIGAFFTPASHRLVLARAGHLPLFHYRKKTGTVERVTPRGLGLGLNAEGMFAAELEERPITYSTGDVFLLVTDGITEAQRVNGEEFGEERVVEILRSSPDTPAAAIRDGLMAAVASFTADAPQHDDQTVVVVKVV